MASVIGLHFNMQDKDIFEHANAKCVYVHISQLVDHFVT